MVVCKCRKATKLYCFVHKVPLCGECITAPEHAHCVVRTYSEWVIDGDYDWPPKCPVCQENLEESQKETVRLGCMHVLHVECLEKHLQSFPPYTAPAGFVCPTCNTPLWPPKSIKDAGTSLYNNLKGALAKSSVANTLLGLDNPVASASEATTPASSSPLTQTSQSNPPVKSTPNGVSPQSEIVEHEASSSAVPSNRIEAIKEAAAEAEVAAGPHQQRTTPYLPGGHQQSSSPRAHPKVDMLSRERRNSMKVHSSVDVPDDYDEDVERKYARRGPWYLRTLQRVLPSNWTSAQVLPVSMPGKDHPRGDSATAEDLISGQRRRLKRGLKNLKLDMRKGLMMFAILSSVATLIILYLRLAASIVNDDGAPIA